jgi:hypothetical protein
LSGRARLPGGEPRKASQRNKQRAASSPGRISPTWRVGDVGDDEHAEIVIAERVYRVRISELR